MKKFSKEVNKLLSHLKINNITNLYNSNVLNLIDKFTDSEIINTDILKQQLPDGIYTTLNEIKSIISNEIKNINTNSISYSPLSLYFNELKPCKQIGYRTGNIITGRDQIINKILLNLTRKNKRGVILVGEAGTGKSGIVYAINAKLIERTVPRSLIGSYMLNMDIPYILNKYKEESINIIINILEKASEFDKAILFVDEVHQLFNHRMNDILKPYLTEKMRMIGCTTVDEYHSIITEDPAIERRYTVIRVNEPNIKETTNMLVGTKKVYEKHHNCIINDEECEYISKLGSRFIGNRRNPDKSLDILDIACSILNNEEIRTDYKKERKKKELINNINNSINEISSLKNIPGNRILSSIYIEKAISQITGIDFNKINKSNDYNSLLTDFKEKIVNQDECLEKLANTINIYKNSSYDRVRPISILLEVGPAGCGKKSSALLLAEKLYGKKEHLINYDMSGYKESFKITELTGAPPGYVGYKQSGELIKALRNNPSSIVYFRNIQEAHVDIIKYLVDICRTGIITDSAQRSARLNNTIIIFSVTLNDNDYDNLTKNINKTMGFGKQEANSESFSKESLEKIVGSEILNICDDVLIFNKLDKKHLQKIYELNLDNYLKLYNNVDINKNKLKESIIEHSKNGHDIVSKLESEIPRIIFQKLKEKT